MVEIGGFGRLEALVLGTAGSRDASLNYDPDLSLGGLFNSALVIHDWGGFLIVARRNKDPVDLSALT